MSSAYTSYFIFNTVCKVHDFRLEWLQGRLLADMAFFSGYMSTFIKDLLPPESYSMRCLFVSCFQRDIRGLKVLQHPDHCIKKEVELSIIIRMGEF